MLNIIAMMAIKKIAIECTQKEMRRELRYFTTKTNN